MKIKFGNISIELPYKEFTEKFGMMANPFAAMFSKTNEEFFQNFIKMSRTGFTKYFEEYRKWMEKHADM